MQPVLDFNEEEGDYIEDLQSFIGPSAAFYVTQWRQLRTGQILTFNFPAFVFGFIWMLYRRMYQPAVVYLSIYFAEGFLEKRLFQHFQPIVSPTNWFMIRNFMFSLLLGVFANWIYLNFVDNRISQLKKEFGHPNYKAQLPKKGGTSYLAVIAFLVLMLLMLGLNQYFLGAWIS